MTDHSGMFSAGPIPPEALAGMPSPMASVQIGRSTWQGPEDQAPRPAPLYVIKPLQWSKTSVDRDRYEAYAMDRHYRIRHQPGMHHPWFLSGNTIASTDHPTLEAAQLAAQDDFAWEMGQWILPNRPAPSIPLQVPVSTDLLLAQLDSHLARHGFAEAGVLRSLVRSIGADIRSLERKSHG